MPGSGKNFPASRCVVIANSFGRVLLGNNKSDPYYKMANNLPALNRVNFNDPLPGRARGIYIGASGNFDIFIELPGNSGVVIPFLGIAGGVTHPICPAIIWRNDRYTTDAPNIVVHY